MKRLLFFFTFFLSTLNAISQKINFNEDIGIIPTPQSVTLSSDMSFCLSEETFLLLSNDDEINRIILSLEKDLEQITNYDLKTTDRKNRRHNFISLKIIDKIDVVENPAQAYLINISEKIVEICATTPQGLFYGTQSFKQLLRYYYLKNNNLSIPCYNILDYPNIEYRGWMDDISRGPVPTMDFIKKEIVRLSEYKMNFFNLYTEHLFYLDEYPDIAPADGLTSAEIKEITDFAKDYYIEFFANQQCFAHAEKTLDNPFYDDIKDTRFNFNPAKNETYDFLEALLSETALAYESSYFNINCDETESLGNGKAKTYVDSIGAEEVYCSHINKVYDILKKYDKNVMMWGDIIAKNPEMVNLLPEDIQFIVWSYGGRDSFDELIEPFRNSGHEFWVAPGASMWATSFPNMDNYIINIANFARDGYKNGAKGIMNTAWDDYGESMFNEAWHAMIWCAETSWNTLKTNDEGERKDRETVFNNNFNIQFFNKNDRDYLTNLYELNKMIDESSSTNLMFFTSLNSKLLEFYPSQVDSVAEMENQLFKKEVFDIYLNLLKDKASLNRNDEIIDLAIVAAYRAYVGALKNELKISMYNTLNNPSEYNIGKTQMLSGQFADSLHTLKKRFVRAWNMESRSYYRDVITLRYDNLLKDVQNAPNYVFINTFTSEDGFPMVSLRTIYNDRAIYYSTDGSIPDKNSKKYEGSFKINNSCVVKAVCFEDNRESTVAEKYILYHKGMGHFKQLNSVAGNYRPEYSAGGNDALLNGIVGSDNYKDGCWQGFYGNDCDIELKFDKKEYFKTIKISFITNPYDWILMPRKINVYASADGLNYTEFKSYDIAEDVPDSKTSIVRKTLDVEGLSAPYIKIIVENPGYIPEGLPGYNNPSWMFLDEIIIE